MKEKTENSPPAGEQAAFTKEVYKHYDSRALFGGRQEILIEHAGHAYRLRITRQDKLILTK